MSRMVIRRLAAKRDLAEQAFYIAQNNPTAGFRFLKAADETFGRLASLPGIGRPWRSSNPRLEGVRAAPIRGFDNYLVFYRAVSEGVEILHVLHGARDIEPLLEAEPSPD